MFVVVEYSVEECADNGIADRTADVRDEADGVVAEDVAVGVVETLIASVDSTVGLIQWNVCGNTQPIYFNWN